MQYFTDRLDPPPETVCIVVPVVSNKCNYLFCWRSSAAPMKLVAAIRISLARFSSLFSFARAAKPTARAALSVFDGLCATYSSTGLVATDH